MSAPGQKVQVVVVHEVWREGVHAEGRLGGEGEVEGSMLEKREESTATWRAEKGMRGGWNEEEEATKKWKGVMERERLWLELLLKARKGGEG